MGDQNGDKNKKAYFNYFIKREIEAGIALVGTEIKSVKKGSINITDSYIRIKNGEAYIINMFIEKYDAASIFIMKRQEKENCSYIKKK